MASLSINTPLLQCFSKRPSPVCVPQGSGFTMGVNQGAKWLLRAQTVEPMVEPEIQRRSGNYPPSYWNYNELMSLTSDFQEDKYKLHAEKLKEEVRKLLNDSVGTVASLELVDALQRLGIGYHYEEEIKKVLKHTYIQRNDQWLESDLYITALRFRLLRQHGYDVPQDVFHKFKDEKGNFKKSLCEDIKGMLNLYEASYFGLEGEILLDEAKTFTTKPLNDLKTNTPKVLKEKVDHSLNLPLHWSFARLEARWYIDIYEVEENMNPLLLEFAKLDYNMVQAIYQGEVSRSTKWWVKLGLQKLNFFRDRLLEHFFWAMGIIWEPQYGRVREGLTKSLSFITLIDDIYDVYGSFEELQLFTEAIERWDIKEMEKLPYYMKICYLALINSSNEISYDVLKEVDYDVTLHHKKAWAGLCKRFLIEAKWFYEGYTPTLEEYLENAVYSVSAPLLLVECYCLSSKEITKEALEYIESLPELIYYSALILRLSDDLATSKDEMVKGDVPKAIQCYMHETGVSEEVACRYIRNLIDETWKKMNKARVQKNYPFSEPFITAAPNLSRISQCIYQYGDGHGSPNFQTKDRLSLLVVQPIPLKYN